jgi:hypothetical protein
MKPKLYIGLGHKARQGKDTVARALHAWDPEQTRVMAFSDALYAYCRVVYGMREKDPKLLQFIGSEGFRAKQPDIWIEVLESAARNYPEPIIIIPDVRFENEAEFVRRNGGVLMKIARFTENADPYRATDRDPHHVSETALDNLDWDYTLINHDGLPDRVTSQARQILRELMAGWLHQGRL